MAVISTQHISLDAAAAALRSGQLVVFPTETVYGLGALAGASMTQSSARR